MTNLTDLDVTSLSINGTALTPTAAQFNLVVQGIAAGYKLARGTQIATASKAIATGLTTITGYAVSAIGNTATKANAAVAVSAAASSGTLTVYRWKHTGATTVTLLAATAAGTVSYVAIGT